jgi:flavin-dependent amine oxidoreductase/putative NAD(P)-binding protein
VRGGVAAGMLRRALAAAAYAQRSGCGIDEATEVVAAGAAQVGEPGAGRDGLLTRRRVLGGAGAAIAVTAIPLAGRTPAAARSTGHRPRVVIVGSGLAGLGCAFRLWHGHGLHNEIYEYNAHRIGGRVHTLRGFFDGGQYAEQHGEFISSEHTKTRGLAHRFGLPLDNVSHYPPHTRAQDADHWTGNLYTHGTVQGGWGNNGRPARPPRHPDRLAGRPRRRRHRRRYGLTTFEGPAPAAMVRDFLRDFEVNFPGAAAAYGGKAYYAWSSGDPHIGGAYSYLKAGQYTGFNGIQGRRHGDLHFASEHTSGNFQGYMEGALRSGYRCAREIGGG